MQHLSELHNQTCIRVVLQRDNFIRVKQIVLELILEIETHGHHISPLYGKHP